MNRGASVLVQLVGLLLPSGAKRALLASTLGWSIGPGTTIGCSIILCDQVRIGAGSYIGHGNIFRDLKLLEIGDNSQIRNFNHFMAGQPEWPATIRIGNNTLITSHHFFDCSGRMRIGNTVCIGGRDSQFWTHYLSRGARIEWRELTIDDGCYVCARATLVYCKIPGDTVIGAGAVVTGDFTGEGSGLLLAGNPARIKKRMVAT
jgi:acetyltransferase-like isoleucine patch superfamily enzyme